MTRAQLEHAIRAACDVAGEQRVVVFGSQAILAQYPHAPDDLRESMEADIAPGSNDPAVADRIDASLGMESQFHQTHGFFVHGLTLEAADLPVGWESRAILLQNDGTRGNAARCVEAHDLAASKLAAFRPKDKAFVRTLLAEHMIRIPKLKLRVRQLQRSDADPATILRWIDLTQRDLAGAASEN